MLIMFFQEILTQITLESATNGMNLAGIARCMNASEKKALLCPMVLRRLFEKQLGLQVN